MENEGFFNTLINNAAYVSIEGMGDELEIFEWRSKVMEAKPLLDIALPLSVAHSLLYYIGFFIASKFPNGIGGVIFNIGCILYVAARIYYHHYYTRFAYKALRDIFFYLAYCAAALEFCCTLAGLGSLYMLLEKLIVDKILEITSFVDKDSTLADAVAVQETADDPAFIRDTGKSLEELLYSAKEEVTASVEKAAETDSSSENLKMQKHWFCPNCGKENTGRYCSVCGSKKPE